MKIAVVLLNLGGPDRTSSVKPFLTNLFSDPAILQMPALFRKILAHWIAFRRTKVAIEIYNKLGGGSPILKNTLTQRDALVEKLNNPDIEIFIAMRYWHPMTLETVKAVKIYDPKLVILLPLYPQFSTTTSGSSFRIWKIIANKFSLNVNTKFICCYHNNSKYIDELVRLTIVHYREVNKLGATRILFSAHGLPTKIIKKGDPYQWQIEQTALAVVAKLRISKLDWMVSYQSRVGPMEWLAPSTEDEIKRAGAEKINLVICPIAFVSEHSETLVELDMEYREVAHEHGVPNYRRVETVGRGEYFISGLADLIHKTIESSTVMNNNLNEKLCPSKHSQCPFK